MSKTENENGAVHEAQTAFARGDFDAAYASAGRALAQAPSSDAARVIRINAALKLERWAEAIPELGRLIAANPANKKLRSAMSVCWLRIGNAHKSQNQTGDAQKAYRQAIAADPKNTDARFNLGVLLLDSGESSEAIEQFSQIVNRNPEDNNAALKLAEAYIASGQNDVAAQILEKFALKTASREQLQQCSKLLLRASPDSAKAIAQRLIEQAPDAGDWAREFCRQLRRDGDLDGSRHLLGVLRKLSAAPVEQLQTDLAEALGLASIYADVESLSVARAEFLHRLDDFVLRYPPSRIAEIQPRPEALLWDNFYLAYQGENDCDPQCLFGDWLSASLRAVLPAFPLRKAGPRKKPRLATVSSRFHECTVGAYFASWVEYLAKSGWEVVLVHVGTYRDEVTEKLAAASHGELTLNGKIAENAQQLHGLDADLILYPELGMDHRVLALAALRLAPHQICAWGHPVTTGLPTIDAFVSCTEMEPEHAQAHYREKLLTLPGLGTRYLSPRIPAAASRQALGLPQNGVLYLVPQSLFKLHPDNDRVFVDVLQRDKDASLVFFNGFEPGVLRIFRERLSRALHEAEIPAERALFLPMRPRQDYLQVNLACDIMLDSLHWSGGNTTLDALHAALPVLTAPGRFMRGRQSMAMLQRLDCNELIAESPRELALRAVDLAHSPTRRIELASRIRHNLPTLTQSDVPLQALDDALKRVIAVDELGR